MFERKITHWDNLKARSIANVGKICFLIACCLALSLIVPPRSVVRSQTTQEEARDKQFAALLAKAESAGQVRVIVGVRLPIAYRPEGLWDHQEEANAQRLFIAQVQESLLSRIQVSNRESVKRFKYVPYLGMKVSAETLKLLKDSPEVFQIQEDRDSKPSLIDSAHIIGADLAWASGYTGAGQTIIILDSGVDASHPMLSGKIVSEACYSTSDPDENIESLCENESTAPGSGANCPASLADCYHGTHVAGIAAGRAVVKSDGRTISGIAKDANIISMQVFRRIKGTPDKIRSLHSDQMKALERVHDLALMTDSGGMPLFRIAAVNMSLGDDEDHTSNCDGDARKHSIDDLRAIGIATVIASGNSKFTQALSAPACISSAISVGSTNKDDTVRFDSNVASFLNLFAPGDAIESSVLEGGYATLSGTSMATPHVVGAWAVMKSKFPNATVSQVLNTLVSTGKPITDTRAQAPGSITKPRIQLDIALNFVVTSDLVIQDDRRGDLLLINSQTGEYQYTRCGQGGFTMSGRGEITRRGCLIRLTDGSRVTAVIDRCLIGPRNTGQVVIKTTPLGPTFFINDSNILNNSAVCPGVPVPN